jgi:Uma2 family endonuclease
MSTAVLDRPTETAVRPLDLPEIDEDDEFEPRPHLWTRNEYYQLAETELFQEGTHVELIEGMIVEMAAMHSPHVTASQRLRRALSTLENDQRHLRLQAPLSLGPDHCPSDPEPDAALVAGTFDDYEDSGHPKTAMLVVEVAESSLKSDRGWKSSLYAAADIQEYWIIDVKGTTLEVRRQPQPAVRARFGANYAVCKVYAPGDVVRCLAVPEVEIPVAAFFRKATQS